MKRILIIATISVAASFFVPPLAEEAPATVPANLTANAVAAEKAAPELGANLTLSDGLERVITAQTNQISILTFMIAAMGAIFTLVGLGLVTYIIRRVKEAVDDRAFYLIERKVNLANLSSTRLNAAFYANLLDTARDLAYARRQDILRDIDNGRLDLANRDNFDELVRRSTDILLTPLHIFATIHEILASSPQRSNVRENVWMLYAEVRADNISPKNMRSIVQSMTEILTETNSRSPAIPLLKSFVAKLAGVTSGDELTDDPGF